jgi:hypothetical protein
VFLRNTTSPFLIICILILVIAAVLMAVGFGTGDPGGPDDGLLHLAGATALLRGEDYPLVQRPPLYSGLIALTARLSGADVEGSVLSPEAQELGSITFFEVSTALQTPQTLRTMLWLNILCWLIAAVLVLLTLRELGIGAVGLGAATTGLLLPSSWQMVGLVSETPLCQLLFAVGIYATVRGSLTNRSLLWWMVAGVAFALLGLAKPTFQLLSPVIAIAALVGFTLLRREQFRATARFAIMLIVIWGVLVCGWSIRNSAEHGFLGVSGVGGVALSTRTALYVERGAATFPEEAPIFTQIRDELFVQTPQKPDIVYWGARASNWLMSARGLSYLDANRFLTAYNLAVIRAAPLNYLLTFAQSGLYFQFPSVPDTWPTALRLVTSGIELLVTVSFWIVFVLWLSLHALSRLGWLKKRLTVSDVFIALCALCFLYTMAISSGVDVGKPEHRLPVQMLVIILIVLGTRELVSARHQGIESNSV